MFIAWSRILKNKKLRWSLVAICVPGTMAFAPMSIIGAYMLLTSFVSDAPDRWHLIGWSIVGTGGVLGIVGAWVRLLISSSCFQSSGLLKWGTVVCLAAGVLVAGLTFSAVLFNPAYVFGWVMAPAIVFGVFLLGATLGEVRSNNSLKADVPDGPRP